MIQWSFSSISLPVAARINVYARDQNSDTAESLAKGVAREILIINLMRWRKARITDGNGPQLHI
ncbi:hypothetical protein RB25_09770 [Herbaspirillum rubrisubalbicans]|uniref:Uncharacterized protein n=1 Tax=Herbaspirillum rubrisubalbicans TaxID=80842 RepID=A0ABX9C024_9BURK|nr:hypothetical protein RB24_16065 [Herbaspirillum rubrisubalbicans]RAN48618.1 hypothetical protein RB25_09770 [Herbaspirillum rubrisubalbicans]